jgi:hypothetical protein
VPVPLASPNKLRSADVTRIKIGNYINTGEAWLEWVDGGFLHASGVLVGVAGSRKLGATSFEQWLSASFEACRLLYNEDEWNQILKPPVAFTQKEHRIVDAISSFTFRKVGVAPDGDLLVEVNNRSPLTLPYLTVGVRDKRGMTGSSALMVSQVPPGATMLIKQPIYKGAMNPHGVELFSLPLPDPEDRPYYKELLQMP